MKRLFSVLVAIMLMAVAFESCSTTRHGEGKGYSTNEQVARDMADLNAVTDASKQDNYTVTETSKITTVDNNGEATTKFESVKTGSTKATFTDNTFRRKSKKFAGKWRTKTLFKGKVKKNKATEA